MKKIQLIEILINCSQGQLLNTEIDVEGGNLQLLPHHSGFFPLMCSAKLYFFTQMYLIPGTESTSYLQ